MTAEPSESRRDRDPSELDDSLAEVFSRFSLDSDRRTRRHGRTTRRPTGSAPKSGRARAQDAQWPAADTDLSKTAAPVPGEPPVSAEPPVPGEQDQPASWRSDQNEQPAASIRPYSWTGGRTRSNYELELETLVSVSEMCHHHRLERLEQQSIAELCRHPRSVAEVGALLGVPLGVAKVLLGDMADLGLITVHHTVTTSGSTSHLQLMERVLSGLRRL